MLSSGETIESASHDDYSQVLKLVQQSTRLLERYPVSGALTELDEGISRNYAQGSPSLDASGTCFHCRFERLGDVTDVDATM